MEEIQLLLGEDAMPQPPLPLFPADVTSINAHLSFAKREGRVYYFNGPMAVFSHEEKD
jgi:hypothetical protein